MKNPFARPDNTSDHQGRGHYKCPGCNYHTNYWGLLKGHAIRSQHGQIDRYSQAKDFDDYRITEEEFNALNCPKPSTVAYPRAPVPGVSVQGSANDLQIQITINIRGGRYGVL